MYKLLLSSLILLIAQGLWAADEPALEFITLGTAGGPEGRGLRAQPANVLVIGDNAWLVDAGDGAASQLTRTGLRLDQVQGVLLSHLHFDHTGGMLAVLGLRAQMEINRSFTIYGPPGTGEFIEGLLTAMAPAVHAGFGLQGQSWQSRPVVHEVRDGAEFQIDGVNVTLVENSHYQSGTKTVMEPGSVSLSFRFDSPARSIVYTGDTGPSTAVTRLSANADLLVIEMMDGPVVLDNIRRFNPDIDNEILKGLTQHFALHHLSPEQVARLATAARVGKIVVTHFMPGANTAEQAAYYRVLMQQYYDGEITFAQDLERY